MASYTIKYGDTLGAIAKQNNTTVDALAKFNGITDPNKIIAGKSINLPDALPPPPTAPASTGKTTAELSQPFASQNTKPVVQAAPTGKTVSTSELERGTKLPDASTYATTNKTPNLSEAVSKVAGTTLSATGSAIDSLLAQKQALEAADKLKEEKKVAGAEKDIAKLGKEQATANQDALDATRKKFAVDQTIADLQSIQTKIAGAQEALTMGLIYEGDRPVRMSLLLGRQATLQKQGLATIGALQATAQILQGNLDLAGSYAKATIDAINTDNKNAMDALGILLSLHNDKLIQLTADEKTTLDSRITALKDQDKQLQENSDAVFELMAQYPSAAVAGGVTLLDDRATAIGKMLPKMSAMEMQKFNADMASKASTDTDKDGPAEDKVQLLSLKASGMTYPEALNAFSDTLSVDWISAVYRQADPKNMSGKDQLLNSYYGSFVDPEKGGVKEGYEVTVDKDGNPVVNKKNEGGATWWNPLSWF